MFQQQPSEPEGTILRRGWWRYYRRDGDVIYADDDRVPLGRCRVVQSWDLAVKDKLTSDFVVGQVWAAQGQGRRFLLDEFRDRTDFVGSKRAMRQMREKWPQTTATWIEAKANGPAIVSDLRGELSGLVEVEPQGDKRQRAFSIQGDLESGSLWLPEPGAAGFDVLEYVNELGQFPSGAHDDRVDATTQAIISLRQGRVSVGRPSGRPRTHGSVLSRPARRG
jgi:predicted phage terminase large subunit-like protein